MRQRSWSLYNKRTLEKFYEEIFEDEGFKEEKIATKTKGGGLAGGTALGAVAAGAGEYSRLKLGQSLYGIN